MKTCERFKPNIIYGNVCHDHVRSIAKINFVFLTKFL